MNLSLRRLLFVLSLAVFVSSGATMAADEKPVRLRMATTTSTDNSGLLEYLLPRFEEQNGIKVDVIAVGTGKALKLAERGDVDVILVHAPAAELALVEAGWVVNRRGVMVNDFLIVGPPADPAGLKRTKTLAAALSMLKENQGTFVSRGDDSGTHKKERALWLLVDGPPAGDRYRESGQGMEATLRIAHEKEAYTLTDRGTYLALRGKMELVSAFESDAALDNPYSIIVVNPARHRHAKYAEAMRLVSWITSQEGQDLIGAFRVEDEILFHPTAIPIQ
ncbi:MAG: extracellular solute-binding protein [bacterium]|nr:extracellular solute-binding protein [bacterium]